MKAKDLREKSVDELHTLSGEKRRALFDLRFKHFTGQLVDTAALGVARRTIARIETVVREREIAQAGE